MDLLVFKAALDSQVTPEPRVWSGIPDCLDQQDHPDTLDRRDQLVLQDNQDKLEQSEKQGRQDQLVQLGRPVQLGQLDTLDQWVHQDNVVLLEAVGTPD